VEQVQRRTRKRLTQIVTESLTRYCDAELAEQSPLDALVRAASWASPRAGRSLDALQGRAARLARAQGAMIATPASGSRLRTRRTAITRVLSRRRAL